MTGWEQVAAEFHDQVRANCWDALSGQLLKLHRPHLINGHPVCPGCDRDERGTTDPIWPCRTYTIIAATMLNVTDIETMLRARLGAAEARLTSPGPPVPTPTKAKSSAPASAAAGTGHPRPHREKTSTTFTDTRREGPVATRLRSDYPRGNRAPLLFRLHQERTYFATVKAGFVALRPVPGTEFTSF